MLETESLIDMGWLRVDAIPAPVRGQIVQKLRTAITQGHFSPGDRLIERSLCDSLQVSRPSVREALRQLEAEGLIEIVPYRGPVVRTIGADEAAELYDLRAVVEALCAQYFAERGSAQEIAAYERAIDTLDAQLHAGDRAAIFAAKNAYYEAFTDGCHSASIKAVATQLIARLSYLWSTSLRISGRVNQGMAEMRAIAAALRCRDSAGAYEAARTYILHARATGLSALAAGNSQDAGHKGRASTRQPIALIKKETP